MGDKKPPGKKRKSQSLRAKRRRISGNNTIPQNPNIENEGVQPGGRLVLSKSSLTKAMEWASEHGQECPTRKFEFVENRQNIFGQAKIKCECGEILSLGLDDENNSLPVLEAVVLGMLAGGSNYEAIAGLFTTLEVQNLSYKTYRKASQKTDKDLAAAVQKELEENGKEEYRLAMERGEYEIIDGKKVPYITVVVDGAWSKRSYGHSYNANSGCVVIIGCRTKKILYIDTRTKTCTKCSRKESRAMGESESQVDDEAESQENDEPDHDCRKNWDKSSSSMEADMIVAGFKKSRGMNGLMYRYVIGDGDSSTYSKIRDANIYGNIMVEKIECVNHAMKNVNKHLMNAKKDTLYPKKERDYLNGKIERFGQLAKGAIDYNSKNVPTTNDKTLESDLANIPLHVFGEHTKCRDVYDCKKDTPNTVEIMKETLIWSRILAIFNNLSLKAPRLIKNQTSNLAEGFMSHVNKYLSGKRINYSQAGQYDTRIKAATLAYKSPFWVVKFGKRARSQWTKRNATKLRNNANIAKRVKVKPKPKTKGPVNSRDPLSYPPPTKCASGRTFSKIALTPRG